MSQEFKDLESDEESHENSEEFDSSDEDVTMAEELATSYSNSSDFYQNKSNWGTFSDAFPHKTIYKFLTSQGYRWTDKKCKNWTMSSVWQPTLFLQPYANMKRGYTSMHLNLDVLRNLVCECLSPFNLTLENIIAPGSNFMVVRIDEDVKKSIDSYCFRTCTFKLECSEILVTEYSTTVRSTPLTIFGGGKLCKILYETLRKNDIIIIAGAIKHVTFPYGSQRIVLLNHNAENLDVTLLRFSFLPPSSGFSIMEKIKQAKESNEYAFQYFFTYRHMLFHHEEQSGFNFRQTTPNSFPFPKLWTSATSDYIGMPIKSEDDVKLIYQNLTRKLIPKFQFGPRTSPLHIPLAREDSFDQILRNFKSQCPQKISMSILSIFVIALLGCFVKLINTYNESCILKTDNVLQGFSKYQHSPENALIEYSKNPIIEYIEYTCSIFLSVLRYLKISFIWAYENIGFKYIWEWLNT